MCPPSTGKAINLFFSTSPKILSLRFSLALVHRGRVLGIIALNLASLPPPGLLASSWVSWRICHVDILFSLFFLYPVHEWNLLLCLQNRPQSFQVGRCNLCGVAFPPCLAWDTSSLRDGEPTQPCQAHHLVWEYLTLFQASVCSFVPFKHACHVAPSQLHCSICPSRGDKVLALWHERAQQANCPSAAGRDLLVPGDPHHLLFSHSVVSDSLWPYGLQHVRLLCPPLSPEVCSNSCSLSRWCHPTILSSVIPFSSSLSQHQGLFQWAISSHQVTKVLELQLQHQHQSFQWMFRTDFFKDWQWTKMDWNGWI